MAHVRRKFFEARVEDRKGGKRGAVVFSPVATGRPLGVDPAPYLADDTTRIPTHPNSRSGELAPRSWKDLEAAAAAAA